MENQVTIMQEAPAPVAANAPVDMLQYAISQNAGIETIERLMALQEQVRQREAKAAFDMAISKAKAEIPVIMKTQSVGFESRNGGSSTSYKYEDLGQIAKVVDPILSSYGISYRFKTESTEKSIKVTCVVSHELGHFEENSLVAGADTSGNKNAIQAIGSAQTYLQRYTLKAALGLASAKDDDARFSSQSNMETITETQTTRLLDLIEKTASDTEKFCRFHKVQSVADIAAKDFKAVERQLLLKLEQGAK